MLVTLLISVGVISLLAVFLALLMVIADATVGNYGEVKITINDRKELKVQGGQPLLKALNQEGVFIPSACGGRGSCGLCKVKVVQGGGNYLPTELPWISAEEKQNQVRFSCQFKVKNDIAIRIPEELFSVRQFTTKVETLRDLTHDIKEVRLNYETLTADGKKIPGKKTIKPAGPRDAAIPVPLAIRELIGKPSGLVQGNFTSQPPLPGKSPEESWFFAQVTPFQVHLKLGHHNSLVWITDLRTGQPVAGVRVEFLKSTFKAFDAVGDARADTMADAITGEDGIAMLPGTAILDPPLQLVNANGKDEPNLFLRCGKDDDMAVLPVRFDYQVSAEGANRAASSTRRIREAGTGSVLNLRMLRRSMMVFSTGFHGMPGS